MLLTLWIQIMLTYSFSGTYYSDSNNFLLLPRLDRRAQGQQCHLASSGITHSLHSHLPCPNTWACLSVHVLRDVIKYPWNGITVFIAFHKNRVAQLFFIRGSSTQLKSISGCVRVLLVMLWHSGQGRQSCPPKNCHSKCQEHPVEKHWITDMIKLKAIYREKKKCDCEDRLCFPNMQIINSMYQKNYRTKYVPLMSSDALVLKYIFQIDRVSKIRAL